MSDVTRIPAAMNDGHPNSAEELLPAVYDELRRIAAARMANEAPGQTLQPTALVHQAWLKIRRYKKPWNDRTHFFAAAAKAMREILIDIAIRKKRIKHGGGRERVDFDENDIPCAFNNPDMFLDLNEALDKLQKECPEEAKLIELQYFSGLKVKAIAKLMKISPRKTADDLHFARVWLYKELLKMRGS